MQSIKRYIYFVLSSELIKVEFSWWDDQKKKRFKRKLVREFSLTKGLLSNRQFFQSSHGGSKERTTVKDNTGGVCQLNTADLTLTYKNDLLNWLLRPKYC